MGIMQNQAVIEVLAKAVEQLQAMGINCLVSPLALPQGASITLRVGETAEAVIAGDIATVKGAEFAHVRATAAEFNDRVVEAIAEAAIEQAARR